MTQEYFAGSLPVASFEVETERLVSLKVRIEKRWQQVSRLTVECGVGSTRSVRKMTGVSRETRTNLTTKLGATVLQVISASLDVNLGRTLRWDHETESETSFTLKAGRCEQKTIAVYQLEHVYYVERVDRGMFGDSRAETFVNRLDEFLVKTKTTDPHPSCDCPQGIGAARDGWITLHLANVGLSVEYSDVGTALLLPFLGVTLEPVPRDGARVKVDATVLPSVAVFLLDEPGIDEGLVAFPTFEDRSTGADDVRLAPSVARDSPAPLLPAAATPRGLDDEGTVPPERLWLMRYRRGRTLANLGTSNRAIDELSRVIDAEEHVTWQLRANAYFYRGSLREEQRDLAGALADFDGMERLWLAETSTEPQRRRLHWRVDSEDTAILQASGTDPHQTYEERGRLRNVSYGGVYFSTASSSTSLISGTWVSIRVTGGKLRGEVLTGHIVRVGEDEDDDGPGYAIELDSLPPTTSERIRSILADRSR